MDIALILIAAFAAGVLNTIAGGGTFLTFPALVFIGVPPVLANATSTVAALPGYLAGAVGFRAELAQMERAVVLRLVVITLVGGVLGAILLLVSSNEAFSVIVPFLLLAATLVFMFGDRLRAWAASKSRAVTPYGTAAMLMVSIYGGYFNGGLGIVLLALFALWGIVNIHEMNGLKTALSFALAAISMLVYAAGGLVVWHHALAMMLAATAGGYAGAPLSRALPKPVVRGLVAAVGFGMSAIFFWRIL